MNQAASMNMLNRAVYILIDITSIKIQLCIDKVLHNIRNEACLQSCSLQNIQQ